MNSKKRRYGHRHSGPLPFFGAHVCSAAQAVTLAGLQQLLSCTCSYNALAAVWPRVKPKVDTSFIARLENNSVIYFKNSAVILYT